MRLRPFTLFLFRSQKTKRFIQAEEKVARSDGTIKAALIPSAYAIDTKRKQLAENPTAMTQIPSPTLRSSISTRCHSSMMACRIKNCLMMTCIESWAAISDEDAMAFEAAKLRRMLKGGQVEGNNKGSGVKGLQYFELSFLFVAISAIHWSGSFIQERYFKGRIKSPFSLGFKRELSLTFSFKAPRAAS